MSYNRNMEPQNPRITDILEGTLRSALEHDNTEELTASLERLQHEEGPVAEWAEAIGTRLQIRDLLTELKGQAAVVHDVQDPSITNTVRGFLQEMDDQLIDITGSDKSTGKQEEPPVLKTKRIGRLIAETEQNPETALDLLRGFASQPVNAVVPASFLASHMKEIRQDIVETMWPAAVSANEGNFHNAQIELAEGVSRVNHRLDAALSGLMKWN